MKKLIVKPIIATVLLCGVLASAAFTSGGQVGTAVSDSVAANIKGGCSGTESFNCDLGTNCTSSNSRYDACNTKGSDVNGQKAYCSGRLSCGDCYQSIKACNG